MQVTYKTEKVPTKRVYCSESSGTLKSGYALCYDRSNATAVNAAGTTLTASYSSWARHAHVVKPASGNLHNFAGIVGPGVSNKACPCWVDIIEPRHMGVVVNAFSDYNATALTSYATIQPASYYVGGLGEGVVIGRYVQTRDGATTNGPTQIEMWGADKRDIIYGRAVPSSTNRECSYAIWETCPWSLIANGAVKGHVYFNDFIGNYVLAANQAVTHLGHNTTGFTAGTAGTTITMEADEPYGVVSLNSTTDNEDAIICCCGGKNTAGQFVLSSTTRLWMEARIKTVNITDSKYNVFCGFAEEALNSAGALIANTDAMADKDYVGFQRVFADGDKLDTVWNTAGGATSPVTEGADAVTVAADTYVNVGLMCDGTTCYFYGNGVVLDDSITIATADFPDGEEMAFYYGIMLGHGDDASTQIDYVRIAQQRE